MADSKDAALLETKPKLDVNLHEKPDVISVFASGDFLFYSILD